MEASTADNTARVPKAKSLRVSLSPPPEGRPLKRPRLSSTQDDDCDDDDGDSSSLPSLQPELWAQIVDFLPYPSVLSSAVVSTTMLREVMPLVTALHIDGASQLHAGVASRYREVKDIYIYSLIRVSDSERDDDDTASVIDGELCIDEETAARAVPFLSNNFPRLERVFLGRRDPISGEVQGFIPTQFATDDDGKRMSILIDTFSGAFRAGALPANLWVLGLRCWRSCRASNLFARSHCLVCQNACRSFPLRQVADFECEGSSQKYLDRIDDDTGDRYGHSNLYTEQLYGLDVCLSREAIETIVRSRPGGRELLRSKERFLALLGRGTRHVVVPDDGRELYVVKYDRGELGELAAFVRNSGAVDVTTLPSDAVAGAIRRSFAEDGERGAIPPRERCYLARSSFYALKNDLGLRIDEGDFLNADEWNGKERRSVHREDLFSGYDWRFV